MSEKSDIERRLSQLAADEERIGRARVLARAEDGRGAVLRAVAQTIDETVLPATLTLGSQAAGRVTLRAAGRRLRGVQDASGGLDAAAVKDADLDADDVGGVDALMALLASFAAGAEGPVTVLEGRGVESGGRGLSARRLMELIPESDDSANTTSAAVALESQADRFQALLGDVPLACLILPPDGDGFLDGDESLQDGLLAFAEIEVDEAPPRLSLWLRQTGRPEGQAFARASWSDGTVAALAFPAGSVARVVASFRASYAD